MLRIKKKKNEDSDEEFDTDVIEISQPVIKSSRVKKAIKYDLSDDEDEEF